MRYQRTKGRAPSRALDDIVEQLAADCAVAAAIGGRAAVQARIAAARRRILLLEEERA